MQLVDLSHTIETGMPAFRLKNEDGSYTSFAPHIRPFLTHEQTRPKYEGKASFEITEITFQTSLGTYLDAPYHRFPERRDISALTLEDTVLPGIVIDARSCAPLEAAGPDLLPPEADLRGKAVLINFGWDRYWGSEQYHTYPFLSRPALEHLIAAGVRLVGVDTINADDSRDLERPAHTWLLQRDILIVENLRNLDQLHGHDFTFVAAPLKVKGAAAMPLRAFAILP